MIMLESEAVLTFILVSEQKSFTKAAAILDTTQSAVSSRIRRLEKQLETQLIERTTRSIKLSAAGEAFLQPARDFMRAHDQAAAVFSVERSHLRIGISHHLIGADASPLLSEVAKRAPDLKVSLTVDGSYGLMSRYEKGELDAVILLKHGTTRRHGETIGIAHFGWFGNADALSKNDAPVRLVTHPPGCNIRAMAIAALDEVDLAWQEAFIGASSADLHSAILAGFGIGALSISKNSAHLAKLRIHDKLPVLPEKEIVLLSQIGSPQAKLGLDEIKSSIALLNTA
ncbi:LysR family transcriptional regulator [Pseudovibrio japonicus]|uniref:LysR family transcriptional regulator n=1 Tax=Pseudovibrio japonicus TaxID=366534 RepID=A0ABQ3EK87_9HYPH|nr:LysR family transcriptional regulator [Pseudovibrio japonicus]GHB40841.1 LysR family transcriptional regulator [Pseudovibrio japonicus]